MSDFQVARLGDGLVRLTLARHPVNALNPDFLLEIAGAIEDFADDSAVRGVVICSAFKVFSAGLDLREVQDYTVHDQQRIVDALNQAFVTLYAFPKPCVAAVNGAAIAGGLFFPLTADHTVAVESAKFGLAEVRVGASFPYGPLEIARAELTPAGLRRLMLSGQPVDAGTAMQFGIVDELAEPDDLELAAVAAAKMLASSPAGTYAAIKRQIRHDTIDRITAVIRDQSDPVRPGWFTDETKAAMLRMLER